MKVRIFENPDGTLTVRVPVQKPHPGTPSAQQSGESDDEYFERSVWGGGGGANSKGGTVVGDVDSSSLPVDYDVFKESRTWNGGGVTLDLTKAKTIHADHIKLVRQEMIRDVIEREALGDDVTTEKAAVAAVDADTEVAIAAETTSLRAIWPAAIERRAVPR